MKYTVNERAFLHLQFPYSSHHTHQVGQSILLLSHKSWCNKDQTRVGTLNRIRTNISTRVSHKGMTIIFWGGKRGGPFQIQIPAQPKLRENYQARAKSTIQVLFLNNRKILHKLLPREGIDKCTTWSWENTQKIGQTLPPPLPLSLHSLNFFQTKLYQTTLVTLSHQWRRILKLWACSVHWKWRKGQTGHL